MRKITLLLVAVVLASCGSKKKTYNDNLGIPNRVEIKEKPGANYIQFPDTRVFMVMPAGYELNASLEKARVRKNKQTFIDVTEEPNRGIDEVKDAYERTIDEIKEKNPYAICLIQDFKFGNYDARYIFVGNYLPNNNKVTLIFGDEKSTVVMGASFPNDINLQKEITDILLTSYIKPDAKPDHTPFAKYTIDLSKSEFKFNSLINNSTHVYTINGYNQEDYPGINLFVVIQGPDTTTTIAGKKEIAMVIVDLDKNKKNGLTITNVKEQEIQINHMPAYEIIINKIHEKTPVKIYVLCADVEGKTFLFMGTLFKDFDQTIAEYKRIIETM